MFRPRLNLLGKFALLSFFCILALSVALGFVSSSLLTGNMRAWEWQGTAELVRYQVRAYSLERLFTEGELRGDPERYRESLSSLLSLPEVVRVKVWDREGGVIWSDDARLIGRRFPQNRELQEALAGGVSVQLKDLGKSEHVYERERFAKLAEVYVPILSETQPREVIGILEIYKRPVRLFGMIQRTQTVIWTASLAGGLLLYLSLFWIIRIAYRTQLRLEGRLKEQAAELQRRNATLESFLQTLSHDLKASVVATHGLVGMLLETSGDRLDAEGSQLLHRLQKNAEYQARLFTDLLDLSRVGSEPFTLETVEVSRLLGEVVEASRAELGASAPRVTVEAPLPTLYGDPYALREIFRHLVTNALKFNGQRPDPQIRIAARDRGAWVEFSVQDNGIGIHPDYHAKIFEPFHRLSEVEADGTGVGLTIVKRLVERTGGRVSVESTPHGGATFCFTLPKVWSVKAEANA